MPRTTRKSIGDKHGQCTAYVIEQKLQCGKWSWIPGKLHYSHKFADGALREQQGSDPITQYRIALYARCEEE